MKFNNIVSISEVNQNFSKVAKLCKKQGKLYIFKNNKPYFELKNVDENDIELTENEKVEVVGRRILKKYFNAFKELAK